MPLNAEARTAIEDWMDERRKWAGHDGAVSLSGRWPADRASGRPDCRRWASAARLDISAHVLRHTLCTGLVRAGHDLVLVAKLAGHRRLETTRRYSLPSAADRQAAVDGLTVEYEPSRPHAKRTIP